MLPYCPPSKTSNVILLKSQIHELKIKRNNFAIECLEAAKTTAHGIFGNYGLWLDNVAAENKPELFTLKELPPPNSGDEITNEMILHYTNSGDIKKIIAYFNDTAAREKDIEALDEPLITLADIQEVLNQKKTFDEKYKQYQGINTQLKQLKRLLLKQQIKNWFINTGYWIARNKYLVTSLIILTTVLTLLFPLSLPITLINLAMVFTLIPAFPNLRDWIEQHQKKLAAGVFLLTAGIFLPLIFPMIAIIFPTTQAALGSGITATWTIVLLSPLLIMMVLPASIWCVGKLISSFCCKDSAFKDSSVIEMQDPAEQKKPEAALNPNLYSTRRAWLPNSHSPVNPSPGFNSIRTLSPPTPQISPLTTNSVFDPCKTPSTDAIHHLPPTLICATK